MAMRHSEFLDKGVRLFGLSADSPAQNAAVMEKLALGFPILSDEDREAAITPLGFADENDPRQISRPGTVIVDTNGEIVYRSEGRDFADRPVEDDLLEKLDELGFDPTSQEPSAVGTAEAGEKAIPLEGLPHYLRGAKFASLALRSRHRNISDEFKDDAKAYIEMVERYLEALSNVEERRA